MASMETAPAVRQAAQAPATPKRIVAHATRGSGAYSNSDVRSALLDGMKNNRMQTASVVKDRVMASAARLTEIGRCPLRKRSAQCTISGTSVTTAKVLVTVRATTVSHISLEMPDNLKNAAMRMLVRAGASRPPNNTSVSAVRTRSKRRGLGVTVATASAPSIASPTLAKYWIATWLSGNSPSCENRWKGNTPVRYSHQCSRGVSSSAPIRMAFGAHNTDTGADGNASTSPTSAAMK